MFSCNNKLGENKPYKAYYVLKDCSSPKNRYKFAIACMKLQKYGEAEKALLYGSNNEDMDESQIACGAAGLYMLGQICEKQTARQKDALHYFQKALEINPTLWVAFEKICKLAPNTNPSSFFPEDHPFLSKFAQSTSTKETLEHSDHQRKVEKRSSLITPPHKDIQSKLFC